MAQESPLCDREVEDAAVGSILIGGNATFREAQEILDASGGDFYQERLRVIWEAFRSIENDELGIDLYTVNDRVKGQAGVDLPCLMELAGKGNYLRIRQYARIVRKKSIARMALRLCEEQRRCILAGEDPEEILSRSLADGSAVLASKRRDDPKHIKDIVPMVYDEIEKRYQSAGKLLGVPTGFEELDMVINGLRGITVVAARPGIGKTTFALNIAQYASTTNPVLFFSLEMEAEELVEKTLSCDSRIFGRKLEKPVLMAERDWVDLSDSVGRLYQKNLWIDDAPEMKASQIAVRARRMKAMHHIQLIVVDYLQLVEPEKSIGNRNFEIAESMRILKKLSKELKIPILLLSQLNRKIEDRKEQNQIPQNSDLRDSGCIEQDAHIIMFLFLRAKQCYGDIYPVQLLIAKNRKGRKGLELELVFWAHRSKFILPKKACPPEDGDQKEGKEGQS